MQCWHGVGYSIIFLVYFPFLLYGSGILNLWIRLFTIEIMKTMRLSNFESVDE